MNEKNPPLSCFSTLEDPRKPTHSSRHTIMDILLITILASICGADSWVAVEKFAHAKEDWLTILELPHGIPSHDTLGKVSIHLNSQESPWSDGITDAC